MLKRSICPISTKYFSLSLSLSLSSSLCTHTRIHTRIHTAKSHAEKSKVDYESQLQESADEINRYTLKYIHVYIHVRRHAVCVHSMHVYALTSHTHKPCLMCGLYARTCVCRLRARDHKMRDEIKSLELRARPAPEMWDEDTQVFNPSPLSFCLKMQEKDTKDARRTK